MRKPGAGRALRLWPPTKVDGALTVAVTVLELLNMAFLRQSWPQTPFQGLTVPVAAYVVVLGVPLLWRQHAPWCVFVLLGVGTPLGMLLGIPLSSLGLLAAIYVIAAREQPRTSLPAAAAAMVLDLSAWAYAFRPQPFVSFLLGAAAVFLLAWLGGYRKRLRTLEELRRDRERDEEARRVVARERRQVARELHDILAHSMSVIAVQAAGGRRALPGSPEQAAQVLAQIQATSREGMAEVRRLLAVLRSEDAPAARESLAGLDQLDDLVEQVRRAGVRVTVEVRGTARPLDRSVDHSAYRILQEALTNVLRHGGPAEARLLLEYRAGVLRLEVVNRARRRRHEPPAAGSGLLGMRERAALVGGLLEAGPTADGGFRVVAILPLASVPGADGDLLEVE
jgi:signal transduction histidine kinase